MLQIDEWVQDLFTEGMNPPFSFIYDGKLSSEFLKDWDYSHESRQLDDSKTEHLYTYKDPKTGLQVKCKCLIFLDFPAVEWLIYFKNCGSKDTPIIENIMAIDTKWKYENQGNVILHRALGSSASR
ncbi:alpha-galactosidase, partial [Candidatus Poribacteria bacterium]|nr:alpha-galactosidase [Candidatus Poribacteria bacterium]